MRKVIILLLVIVSIVSFSNTKYNSRTFLDERVMQEYSNLTPSQKKEFKEFRKTYMKELRLLDLDIREVEIKIERELLQDNPTRIRIEHLFKKKRKLVAKKLEKLKEIQKDAIDDFGIEIKFKTRPNDKSIEIFE